MAMSKTLVVLGFVVVSMLWAGATGQSSSSCTTVLISLSPCLNFITGNTSTPSSGCCTQLATVVQSQAQCLCEVLNGGAASLGISVNQTRALALPADCKVTTPAVSQCSKGNYAYYNLTSLQSRQITSNHG
ncbi:Non-specific lipid transfer protein GPI-anchored 5-like protein [Drosera capensis]